MKSKRFVSLVLAFALLVGCFITLSVQSAGSMAGAGSGENTKIETVEEFSELLKFIQNIGSDDRDSVQDTLRFNAKTLTLQPLGHAKSGVLGGVLPLSYTNTATMSSDDLLESSKHSSATVHFSTNVTASSQSNNPKYTGGIGSMKQNLNRELTLYICKEGTLYDTEGSLSLTKSYLDKDEQMKFGSTYMQWDMLVYCEGDLAYMYIDQLIFSDEGESTQIKALNQGKWISIPRELASGFVDIEYENREVLGALGELLDILVKHEYVVPNGEAVTLTEQDFITIMEEEGEEGGDWNDTELNFTVDMSNPTRPRLSSVAVTDTSSSRSVLTGYYTGGDGWPQPQYTTVDVSNSSKVSQEISFRNIDNTVVDFDKEKIEIKCDSVGDFEKLFIVKEFGEANKEGTENE